jgi:hypothetical protein
LAVIQRLARGVQAVCKAVENDDEKWLVDDVKLGFSANACEQFANLIEKALVQIPLSWIFKTGNAVDFVRLFRCRLRTKTNFAPEPTA